MEETNIFDYIKNYPIMRAWHYILIHHSQAPDRGDQDWEGIRKWHMGLIGGENNPYTKKPMKNIGYHAGIEFDNHRFVYRIGRPLHEKGAHCPQMGMNDDAIGICVVGNFDGLAHPCHQQYFMLASLCRAFQDKYSIPTEHIRPHWMYNVKKTCPGKRFDMLRLREYVVGIEAGHQLSGGG